MTRVTQNGPLTFSEAVSPMLRLGMGSLQQVVGVVAEGVPVVGVVSGHDGARAADPARGRGQRPVPSGIL